MTGFAVLSTTVDTQDAAAVLARRLVEARLCACVQIVPITSVYRWRETIENAPEHLLLCKIAQEDFDRVAEAIRAAHPYEVPEIVMTPISGALVPYLAWLAESTRR